MSTLKNQCSTVTDLELTILMVTEYVTKRIHVLENTTNVEFVTVLVRYTSVDVQIFRLVTVTATETSLML